MNLGKNCNLFDKALEEIMWTYFDCFIQLETLEISKFYVWEPYEELFNLPKYNPQVKLIWDYL